MTPPLSRLQTRLPETLPLTEALAADIARILRSDLGVPQDQAQSGDWFRALSLALRARVLEPWLAAEAASMGKKRVAYLSMEFLMGRLLSDSALNLGLLESANGALASFGVSLEEVVEAEPDAARRAADLQAALQGCHAFLHASQATLARRGRVDAVVGAVVEVAQERQPDVAARPEGVRHLHAQRSGAHHHRGAAVLGLRFGLP